jgi:hypothetical protein
MIEYQTMTNDTTEKSHGRTTDARRSANRRDLWRGLLHRKILKQEARLKMLTPDDLRAMSAEDQTQLFERLATQFYGTTQNAAKLATDFGVSNPTIFRWRREQNTPWAVIFTLDAWVNSDAAATRILDDWHTLPEDLADVARTMSRVTATLSTIARRMPLGALDVPKSSDPAQS